MDFGKLPPDLGELTGLDAHSLPMQGFNLPFGIAGLSKPPNPRGDLRDKIPSGKGRIDADEYLKRVKRAQLSGMKSLLDICHTESGEVCIVGGGPTLQEEVGALRRLVKRGVKTIAVNKSHDWLMERGLPCHYSVLLDPKDWVVDYVDLDLEISGVARKRVGKMWVQPKHLIASQCADNVLQKFKGHPRAYLWHAAAGLGESEMLNSAEFAKQPWIIVAGASVVGLRAVALAHGLGFRKIHLFGLDGSMKRPSYSDLLRIWRVLEPEGPDPTADEVMEFIMTVTHERKKLPDAANAVLEKYHYSYAKPHVDATWRPFTVELKTGWTRSFMANHHMARAVYEFEDAMKDWDAQIKRGSMAPFNVVVHGNPEHSAIAMVAAGMGVHADPSENEKYGRAPHAKAA